MEATATQQQLSIIAKEAFNFFLFPFSTFTFSNVQFHTSMFYSELRFANGHIVNQTFKF